MAQRQSADDRGQQRGEADRTTESCHVSTAKRSRRRRGVPNAGPWKHGDCSDEKLAGTDGLRLHSRMREQTNEKRRANADAQSQPRNANRLHSTQTPQSEVKNGVRTNEPTRGEPRTHAQTIGSAYRIGRGSSNSATVSPLFPVFFGSSRPVTCGPILTTLLNKRRFDSHCGPNRHDRRGREENDRDEATVGASGDRLAAATVAAQDDDRRRGGPTASAD